MTRLVLVAGVVLGAAVPALPQTTITMLDGGAGVGFNPAIAVGPDGLGLIAYYDETNGDLKTAHCSNAACTAATIATIDSTGDVGRHASLAIGADGLGVISYYDATTPALKVAHCNDAACTSATVTPVDAATVSGRTAIAIGSDGLPLVAYRISGPSPGLRTAHCPVAACTTATVAAPVVSPPAPTGDVALAIMTNGLGLIAHEASGPALSGPLTVLRRCANVPCTALQPGETGEGQEGVLLFANDPALVVPGDGHPLRAYGVVIHGPAGQSRFTNVGRCSDAACGAFVSTAFQLPDAYAVALAVQPNGLGWAAWPGHGQIRLRICTNDTCTSWTDACAASSAAEIAMARGGDGRSLIAFRANGLGVAHDVSDACPPPQVDVADTTVAEGTQAVFPVGLSVPQLTPTTVNYATEDGTALAGQDYVATSGVLTIPTGQTTTEARVTVLPDGSIEPDETFHLILSSPVGAVLGDSTGTATILGEPLPDLVAGPCSRPEGDVGTQGCVFAVSLAPPVTQTVTVDYATAAGTATAGVDYLEATGTLTFAPGSVAQTVSVSVVGDLAVELDESFFLDLSNATNATILEGTGLGTIVDDDAPSLSTVELTHGSRITTDLAAAPGPVADPDLYKLAQGAYSSWEIVVDEVSGDAAPDVLVELLAEDNATVLATGAPVGTGAAQSLRWERREPTTEVRHHVRVGSTSCAADCGSDDTYRLRVFETTGMIPRFNNAGSQITVLVLQNATTQAVQANADFWRTDGSLAATVPVPLGPNAVGLLNTSTIAALAGLSGSVTVTHDGPYGALAGKAVALEPSTGFSFDSPMSPKPR